MKDSHRRGLFAAVSLLAVAVMVAAWSNGAGWVAGESQESSSMKPIVEWTRERSGFGTEYEYRTNGASVAGYTKRGTIAMLFAGYSSGRRLLFVHSNPSNPQMTKFSLGARSEGYTTFSGVAGFCLNSRPNGDYAALMEVSKENSELKVKEYAYTVDFQQYIALLNNGFKREGTLCYVKKADPAATPKPTPKPTPQPTPKPSTVPSTTKPIVEWVQQKIGSPTKYEYRTDGSTVYRFRKRRIIGSLFSSGGTGRTPVKIYSTGGIHGNHKFGEPYPPYSHFVGIAGYVSSKKESGMTFLMELSKYNKETIRREFVYVSDMTSYMAMVRQGYSGAKSMGFIQQDNSVRPIVEFTRIREGHSSEFQFRTDGMFVPGFKGKGAIGSLFPSPGPGRVTLKIYYDLSMPERRKFSVTGGSAGYTTYYGIAGYCHSSDPGGGYRPLIELYRTDKKSGKLLYRYMTEGHIAISFPLGYKYLRILCYIAPLGHIRDLNVK